MFQVARTPMSAGDIPAADAIIVWLFTARAGVDPTGSPATRTMTGAGIRITPLPRLQEHHPITHQQWRPRDTQRRVDMLNHRTVFLRQTHPCLP